MVYIGTIGVPQSERDRKMVAFKDLLDKATFSWVDERPPIVGRGATNTARRKYDALLAAVESNPTQVLRLTAFFGMRMDGFPTNFRKYVIRFAPDKKDYIRVSTRQEVVEGEKVRVIYIWVDKDWLENGSD